MCSDRCSHLLCLKIHFKRWILVVRRLLHHLNDDVHGWNKEIGLVLLCQPSLFLFLDYNCDGIQGLLITEMVVACTLYPVM